MGRGNPRDKKGSGADKRSRAGQGCGLSVYTAKVKPSNTDVRKLTRNEAHTN